mmetsp:Transcript_13997/g.16942  ORF Transcript_13997/g.16942 Transcript_13997/m.16942 type:complete len:388 (+) Transcript_13997:230-1393(+)|eukprot:CAMPEP_0197860812 /NCGR_PEP_ID=MMETSP1438-20131217/36440_1 /TAXON_ID=1461541 /ORGANISM="Pterosperma sp., Strain CCMP1384" /LENGTH=387 /DNA_ID=CAMNT_0043477797 /DNA_START=228 /DNA_END=1391 /DNA_ORIENTATION=+
MGLESPFGDEYRTGAAVAYIAYLYYNYQNLWKLEMVIMFFVHLWIVFCQIPPVLLLKANSALPFPTWGLYSIRTGNLSAPFRETTVWKEVGMEPRKGDVVCLTYLTPVAFLVHLIREAGEGDFEDIGEVISAPDTKWYGSQTCQERIEWYENNQWSKQKFRIMLRSDVAKDTVYEKGVRYVWMHRDINDMSQCLDAVFRCFNPEYTKEFGDYPQEMVNDDPEARSSPYDILTFSGDTRYVSFGSEGTWVENEKNDPKNWFCIVEKELRANPKKELARLARFLDIKIPEKAWSSILEKCELKWMLENASKFDMKMPEGPVKGATLVKPKTMVEAMYAGENCPEDHEFKINAKDKTKFATYYQAKIQWHINPELSDANWEKRVARWSKQ